MSPSPFLVVSSQFGCPFLGGDTSSATTGALPCAACGVCAGDGATGDLGERAGGTLHHQHGPHSAGNHHWQDALRGMSILYVTKKIGPVIVKIDLDSIEGDQNHLKEKIFFKTVN